MILSRIIEEKRVELAKKKEGLALSELKKSLEEPSILPRLDFKKAISAEGINLIAEIKKRSPSRGILRKGFRPVEIALDYAVAGARALSVLTDEKFFGGDLSLIKEIKKEVSLPVLEKDFIIDEYQVYEARSKGADAVLLIADILSAEEMKRFLGIARSLGMEVLCEVHSEEDLDKAVGAGAEIIGINNRNLHDFKVDIEVTARLARHIPHGKIVVSESGIKTYKDVMYLKSLGVNAVLIGEAFMVADDIVAKVREVMGTHVA
jgi:indole-3-glycerol phosphate synthase